MQTSKFAGVCVALATPMDPTGEQIDEGALLDHVDWLLDAGVHSMLVLSGTGEYAYLRPEERRRIVELVCPRIAGKVPIMVQSSEMGLTDTIESSRHAIDHGAEGLMVLPPWLETPVEAGVMYHYERVAQAVDAEIVVYNTPAASGVEIFPSMWQQLLSIDNITHIKDSQGDQSRLQKLVAIGGHVLCGCDPIAPYALMAGCVGMIWGSANYMPHECVRLYELVAAGKLAEALEYWKLCMPPNAFLWENDLDVGYLPGAKTAAAMVGRQMGASRRPQLPLTGQARLALQASLSTLPINGVDRDRLVWREWADERDWLVQMSQASSTNTSGTGNTRSTETASEGQD